jgi:hypothetical protein
MLSKSNKGALAELRVATLLIAQGWFVFQCFTPNSPVDMIALRRGHTLKIQVKSGANGGNPKFLRQGNNDVLAVVGVDSVLFKVRNRRIQKLFPGSTLARRSKRSQ